MIVIYYLLNMNSNDIFSQIGLLVGPQSQQTSQEGLPYTVYLQIELSQGKNQLLRIMHNDDVHLVASNFCKKHQLNQLAVEIVQTKIIQAKKRQQERIKHNSLNKKNNTFTSQESQNFSKSRFKDQFATLKQKSQEKVINNRQFDTKNQRNNKFNKQASSKKNLLIQLPWKDKSGKKKKLQLPEQATNIAKSKSKSPKKQTKSKNKNKISQKNQSSNALGTDLYTRGMIKHKMHQNKRIKKLQERQIAQVSGLTFQPKINPVSAKIVQFRRENGQDPNKQTKKFIINHQKKISEAEQMKNCTFKPQINKVSDLIYQNKSINNEDYDHFTMLYRQAQTKKQKMNTLNSQKAYQFQPKINIKSTDKIVDTFAQRLQKSLIRKKQIQSGSIIQQQCSFQPKINKGPRQRSYIGKQSRQWWNDLYEQRLKKNQNPLLQNVSQQQLKHSLSTTSNNYYDHLIEKRLSQVFSLLDSNQDGIISPQYISIEKLSKNQLVFLKPLFQQMDQLSAELDFIDFKKAVTNLLKDTDLHIKGLFLREKIKQQEKASFVPQINKKSKQIAMNRMNTVSGTIYDQLYQQGLRELQRKQYYLEQQRTKLQEKQLEQCSFKPQLDNTSKYYIGKVLGKQASANIGSQQPFMY